MITHITIVIEPPPTRRPSAAVGDSQTCGSQGFHSECDAWASRRTPIKPPPGRADGHSPGTNVERTTRSAPSCQLLTFSNNTATTTSGVGGTAPCEYLNIVKTILE